MKPVILCFETMPGYERSGGARTTPLVKGDHGAMNFMNGVTELPPGGMIPLHQHDCEESVIVLKGSAIAEIDGTSYTLDVCDTVWIPPGIPHRFINASSSNHMLIFWTYGSINASRTLVTTGETRRVSDEHGNRQ